MYYYFVSLRHDHGVMDWYHKRDTPLTSKEAIEDMRQRIEDVSGYSTIVIFHWIEIEPF